MSQELFKGKLVDDSEYTDEFIHYAEESEGSLLEQGDWRDIDINHEESVLWDEDVL